MGKVDDESLSRLVAVTGPAGSSNVALAVALASVRQAAAGSCAVILVEGVSDQSAVEALAAGRGRNLRQEGVFVVPMGGATNIGHFLGPVPTRDDLERLGFYVCVADLEDELIRALGTATVERLIAAQGELGSFRILCRQPAQRNRTREQQLRRFMGARAGRKIHYGQVLVEALDPTRVPRPLDRVLAHV